MRMLSGETKVSSQYFIRLYTYSRRYGKYTKKVNGELVKGLYIQQKKRVFFNDQNRLLDHI